MSFLSVFSFAPAALCGIGCMIAYYMPSSTSRTPSNNTSESATYRGAGNFSADLKGPADTRLATWGTAEACIKAIQFRPPEGQRVRMLKISGDLIAFPKVEGGQPVANNAYAGVLAGFFTSAADASVRADWLADNTMLYVQGALQANAIRVPFSEDLDYLLEPDNRLLVKMAAYLNTTGYAIHLEVTYNLTYRFEDSSIDRSANPVPRGHAGR